MDACLKPWFKTFRLGISYYTAYVHFPVSNASETASIFLTLLLSLERYIEMHKISCSGVWCRKCSLHNLLCCRGGRSSQKSTTCHKTGAASRLLCCTHCHQVLGSGVRSLRNMFSIYNKNIIETLTKVIILSILINIPLFFRPEHNYEISSS